MTKIYLTNQLAEERISISPGLTKEMWERIVEELNLITDDGYMGPEKFYRFYGPEYFPYGYNRSSYLTIGNEADLQSNIEITPDQLQLTLRVGETVELYDEKYWVRKQSDYYGYYLQNIDSGGNDGCFIKAGIKNIREFQKEILGYNQGGVCPDCHSLRDLTKLVVAIKNHEKPVEKDGFVLPEKFCFNIDADMAHEFADDLAGYKNICTGKINEYFHYPAVPTGNGGSYWFCPFPQKGLSYTDISPNLSEYYRVWREKHERIPRTELKRNADVLSEAGAAVSQSLADQKGIDGAKNIIQPDRKIKGYKQPVDFKAGRSKKGDKWIPASVYTYANANQSHGSLLPAEIVETWEPVYEDEEKIFGEFIVKGDRVYSHGNDVTVYFKQAAQELINRQKGGEK